MQTETNTRQVTLTELKKYAMHNFKTKRPMFVWGPPGIGKSETFEQIKFLKTGSKFFEKNKIIYIDLNKDMEVIRVNKKNYMIKYDGHPNELANQVIYKIVFDKLKNYIE